MGYRKQVYLNPFARICKLREKYDGNYVPHQMLYLSLLPNILCCYQPFQYVVHPLSLGLILPYSDAPYSCVCRDLTQLTAIQSLEKYAKIGVL